MTESLINKLKSLQIINPDINNFETIKEEYNIIDNKNEVEFMQQILKNIIVILPENIDTPEKIKFACIEYLGNDPPNATPPVKPIVPKSAAVTASLIEPAVVTGPVTKNPLTERPSLSASTSSLSNGPQSVFSSRNVTPLPRGRLPPLSLENAARRTELTLRLRPSNNNKTQKTTIPQSSSSSAASSRAPSRAPSRPATGTIYATGPKTFVPQIFEFTIPSTGKILTIQLNTTKEGISSTEGINKRIFKIVDDKIKIDISKDRAEKYYDAIINIKEYTKEYDKDGYIMLKPRNIKP
jgi:hypothetical protein